MSSHCHHESGFWYQNMLIQGSKVKLNLFSFGPPVKAKPLWSPRHFICWLDQTGLNRPAPSKRIALASLLLSSDRSSFSSSSPHHCPTASNSPTVDLKWPDPTQCGLASHDLTSIGLARDPVLSWPSTFGPPTEACPLSLAAVHHCPGLTPHVLGPAFAWPSSSAEISHGMGCCLHAVWEKSELVGRNVVVVGLAKRDRQATNVSTQSMFLYIALISSGSLLARAFTNSVLLSVH